MQAYAEGLNVLKHANIGLHAQETDAETTPLRDPDHFKFELDVAAIAEVWRRGSVISSWLLDLTAQALHGSPELNEYAGRVSDSGEGRWTVQAAVEEGVPAPVLAASLFDRFASRGEADWGNRVLSAMRHAFGGHLEKSPEQ
jgi:6-phosphogluconate dehydrogenase